MHLHHSHLHGAASLSPANAFASLAARHNNPFTHGSVSSTSVGDYGILANITGDEMAFTHGLSGVNQAGNYLFAACLGLTLAGLCVLTVLFRWARMGNAHMRHMFTLSNPEHQRYWTTNQTTWWPKIKQHLLYAPLFRTRHNRELQLSNAVSMGTLPSRFHTLILLVYIASNIAYCLVLSWNRAPSASVIAELRGRSGELATMNLIPTIVFALRNNPLIPLTRVSFDTFNLFHRWCARVVVVESIVHTLCFLVNTATGGMVQVRAALATSASYQWGLVATCAFTLVIIQSFSPIRHAFYELFINLHRALVLLGLIGVYIHIERANLPQLPYVRAAFALWGAEWAARLYRVWHYNISMRSGMTTVKVEALPAEACRVTFELARPWKFVPGAHIHTYLPAIGWWSSHPFSVAWSETESRVLPMDLDLEKLPPPPVDTPQRRSSTYKAPIPEPMNLATKLEQRTKSQSVSSVSVIMRARTGMTRKLYEKAAASPSGQITISGAIEGPYGGHESLSSYGTVVLFAGGVGITHCVSHVRSLLAQYAEGTCSTRKILLVWSVPNTEALEWVRPWMDQILRMEGRKEVLRIHLFITKPRHQSEVKSNTGTVQMFPGRCNPTTIIEKEVADRAGAMGVVVCGPGAFADSVRTATRTQVQVGSVDFVEEAFTY